MILAAWRLRPGAPAPTTSDAGANEGEEHEEHEERASFIPRGELGPGGDDLPPAKPLSSRPPASLADDSGRYAMISARAPRR